MYLWKHPTSHHRRSQEVSRTADQQSIHHVRLWHLKLSIEEHSQRSMLWKLGGVARKEINCGTFVERHFDDEQHQMHMHEQEYSQSDMEEFDRLANAKWTSVARLHERAHHRSFYNIVQPCQGGCGDTIKTRQHPECTQIVQ